MVAICIAPHNGGVDKIVRQIFDADWFIPPDPALKIERELKDVSGFDTMPPFTCDNAMIGNAYNVLASQIGRPCCVVRNQYVVLKITFA